MSQVTANLAWPGPIERLQPSRWAAVDKVRELTFRVPADAVFWSPTHKGTIVGARHVVTVHDCINVEFAYAGEDPVAAEASRQANRDMLLAALH